MTPIKFYSFARLCSGRVLTHGDQYVIAVARNPYGSHNLVLVDYATAEAFRHGTDAVVTWVGAWGSDRVWRKLQKYLAMRGTTISRY